MSDTGKSGWDRLLDQVTNPWDWAAGITGAAAGAAITIASGGADLGTSIATGFTTGIAARKAGVASLQGRRLRKRAEGLKREIENRSLNNPQLTEIIEELELELSLWESRAISNDDFAKQMDKLIEKCRSIVAGQAQIKVKTLPQGT